MLLLDRRLHSVAPLEWFQGGSRGCNVALKCCDTFVGLAMAFDAVSLFPVIPKTQTGSHCPFRDKTDVCIRLHLLNGFREAAEDVTSHSSVVTHLLALQWRLMQ